MAEAGPSGSAGHAAAHPGSRTVADAGADAGGGASSGSDGGPEAQGHAPAAGTSGHGPRTAARSVRLLAPASIALIKMLPPDFRGGLAWWGRDASYGERRGQVRSHGGFMEGVRTHVHLWPNHRV